MLLPLTPRPYPPAVLRLSTPAITMRLNSTPATVPSPPDLSGRTVVALHAHPDDEAIFTGLTLRRLADAGARTVLVVATAGELGGSRVPLRPGETVADRRLSELERSAELLGVARLVVLGLRDSGLPGDPSVAHPRALARADIAQLARRVADIAEAESAGAIVHDDEHGIYGHPDHRAVGRIGAIAAAVAGVTGYRTTVDRAHLQGARKTHLVHGAARAAGVEFGRDPDEIALAVTGTPEQLSRKRAAIIAHESQVAPDDVPAETFALTYGYEWFRREGSPGVLDQLGTSVEVSSDTAGTAGQLAH